MFSMSSPSFTAAAQSAWPYPQSPSSLRYPFGSHSSTPTTSSSSTTPTSSSAAKTNSYGTSAASTASEQSSRAFPRVAEVRLYASQESQSSRSISFFLNYFITLRARKICDTRNFEICHFFWCNMFWYTFRVLWSWHTFRLLDNLRQAVQHTLFLDGCGEYCISLHGSWGQFNKLNLSLRRPIGNITTNGKLSNSWSDQLSRTI